MDSTSSFGQRLQSVRKRRGMTQRELASASGISVSLIRKLEQGERADTRTETVRKLAVALGVATMALLGDDPPPRPVTAGPEWEPLRRALATPPPSGLEPVTEQGVSRALTAATRLYHGNRYRELAAVLPGLLRDAHNASPLLRSRVFQLAGSALVQTRQRDAARAALDRSLADAQSAGSEQDAASSVITLCWLLLLEQQFTQVLTLATQWADRVEPRLSRASAAELSTWGWLLLRASAAAIRDNRPGEAEETMRLAQAAAVAVGPDRQTSHSYWTTFGPATVAMKRVENAVIDEQPTAALRLAERVPANLRPTSDNRNRHLLDVAAAYLALRDHAASFDVLYQLSRQAPGWLAHQGIARNLLGQLMRRRRTLTPQLRELADLLAMPY